jgi:hypothetical protein
MLRYQPNLSRDGHDSCFGSEIERNGVQAGTNLPTSEFGVAPSLPVASLLITRCSLDARLYARVPRAIDAQKRRD